MGYDGDEDEVGLRDEVTFESSTVSADYEDYALVQFTIETDVGDFEEDEATPSVMVPPLMTLPLKMSLFSKLISLLLEPLTLMLVLLFLEPLLPLLTKMLKKILTALLLDTKLMKMISLSMLTSNTKVLLLTSVDPSFSIWVMKKMLMSLPSGGSLTSMSPLWKTSMVPLMKTLPSLTKTLRTTGHGLPMMLLLANLLDLLFPELLLLLILMLMSASLVMTSLSVGSTMNVVTETNSKPIHPSMLLPLNSPKKKKKKKNPKVVNLRKVRKNLTALA